MGHSKADILIKIKQSQESMYEKLRNHYPHVNMQKIPDWFKQYQVDPNNAITYLKESKILDGIKSE